MKKLYTLFVIAFFSATLYAQVPKFCMIEEFTQAGCSPCATYNAFFEPGVMTANPVKLKLISIHTYFPGTDPMYSNNPTGNDARWNFYPALTGDPTSLIQGTKYSSPAVVTQRDIDEQWNAGSPLKISVTQVDNGNNRDVSVTVKSIGTPPSGTFRLFVAVIQRDTTFTTPPGQNGETYFPDVFRQMLPSDAGVSITLPTIGNSTSVGPYNFNEDQAFWVNPNKIGIVAFVQNMTTKEIIQCGSTFDPPINAMLATSTPEVKNGPASSTQSFNTTTGNTGAASEQFAYTLTSNAPANWNANFTINAVNYTSSANITIPANTSYPVTLNITPGATAAVAKYTLSMSSVTNPTAPPVDVSFYVISGVTDLIVNNANNIADYTIAGDASNWQNDYTSAMVNAGSTTWGITDHLVLMKAFRDLAMNGVGYIYYNVGWTLLSNSIWADSTLVPNFTTFLNNGGRFYIGGMDVAYRMLGTWSSTTTRNFSHNFLGMNYLNDGAGVPINPPLTTNTSDQIFGAVPNSNLTLYYGYSPYGWPNWTPDVIHSTGFGSPTFFYSGDTAQTCAVRATNGIWKTATFIPGIEQLATTALKNQIFGLTYQWFHGMVSTQEYDAAMNAISMGQNYPNPSNATTTISFENGNNESTLQIFDLQGKLVHEEIIPSGTMSIDINTQNLEQGIYFYRLTDGKSVVEKRMEVIR